MTEYYCLVPKLIVHNFQYDFFKLWIIFIHIVPFSLLLLMVIILYNSNLFEVKYSFVTMGKALDTSD